MRLRILLSRAVYFFLRHLFSTVPKDSRCVCSISRCGMFACDFSIQEAEAGGSIFQGQ